LERVLIFLLSTLYQNATALQQMGPAFDLLNDGASDISLNGSIKRADETLVPEISKDRTYPALAIEVGLSEQQKL
jgi:hypothetical protein